MNQQSLILPKTYKLHVGSALLICGAFILLDLVIVGPLCLVIEQNIVISQISEEGPVHFDLNPFAVAFPIVVLLVVALPFVGFTVWLMLAKVPKMRLELTAQGVTLYHYNYIYYTPWQNIAGVEIGESILNQWKGLQLLRSAVCGDLMRGRMRDMAVVQLSWFVFSWRPRYEGILLIPGGILSIQDVLELEAYVYQYAPQACEDQSERRYWQRLSDKTMN